MASNASFYDVFRQQGISRRSFNKFCSITAASLGLGPAFAPRIAHAMALTPGYEPSPQRQPSAIA